MPLIMPLIMFLNWQLARCFSPHGVNRSCYLDQ